MSKNPIAKFMNKFNKPQVIPDKRQKELEKYYRKLAQHIKKDLEANGFYDEE